MLRTLVRQSSVLVSRHGAVAQVTLNIPTKLNALTEQVRSWGCFGELLAVLFVVFLGGAI